jgi:hypothetical protein
MYRGSIALQGVSFLGEWMFGLTEGALLECTAATVVSADLALNNTVGFCIDAGDLGQLVF